MTVTVIIALVFLIVLFFESLAKLRKWHTWQGPDVEPCENCLRWSECHGVDAENCPQHKEWRRV
jgi:hypothetical protein